MGTSMIVPLDELNQEKYGKIICYPNFRTEELEARLQDLKQLRVSVLEFTGSIKINDLTILGKGYASVVVMAHRDNERYVLKIRRTDSRRKDMQHEARILREVNVLGIGPRLIDVMDNFILMEFIEGLRFPEWLDIKKEQKQRIRKVLRLVIEDCWKLDQAGIDHGELSRAPKHIIVDKHDKPVIIDFESASKKRRTSNVTSISQFLFFRSQTARLLEEVLLKVDKERLLMELRRYKKQPNRKSVDRLLQACLLDDVQVTN